ncbi:MAG: hypothetical protein NTZ44_00115 [Candidatus Nomurabacteria bacterium]|nr:hypothetical protein [Candidatus Nomurabacteria bacterium]
MKKSFTMFGLATILLLTTAPGLMAQEDEEASASDSEGKNKFFVIAGIGKALNANKEEVMKKNDVTLHLQFGWRPAKPPLSLGIEMMIGVPFSPATTDSSLVTVSAVDSTHPGYSYYKKTFYNTSLLTGNFGVYAGKKTGGICGGVSIGLGAAFTEQTKANQERVLKTCFVGSLTLDGGYNIAGKAIISVSATYLYLGSAAQGFASDGMTVLGRASLTFLINQNKKD